jgi:uncharacterized protein YbjT (DUF2867 family)
MRCAQLWWAWRRCFWCRFVSILLTADGAHDGETFDVTGPDLLSFDDIAGAFARASGRQITYVDQTLEEARAFLLAHPEQYNDLATR